MEESWTRLLLSLRPCHAPAKVVQTIKQNISRVVRSKFPEVDAELDNRRLWSRGYYVRGVGDVTNGMVRQYVASQREHHGGDVRLLAEYHHPEPQPFFDLRPFDHCVAEYNCHLVISPIDHVPAIDAAFGKPLMNYVLQVAAAKQFDVVSLAVLENHLHLLAALRPSQSPEWLALAMMNNTSHWFGKQNPGAMKLWDAPGLWNPGAFVRTAGAVTTNTVRGHLKNRQKLLAE